MKRFIAACLCLVPLASLPAGCAAPLGQPLPEEVEAYQFWAPQVPEKARLKIETDAKQRTDWSPRRQMIWSTEEFKRAVVTDQRKQRKDKAATRPTTRRAGPATSPAPTTAPCGSK